MDEAPSTTIVIDEEDVDALTVSTDDDQEIDEAVSRIAPSEGGPPVGQEIELPKPENYIPDSMFEAAGGAPNDSVKRQREKTLDEINAEHGFRFANSGSISESVVTSLRCILIEGIPVADDEQLKQAMLLILPAMDDKAYAMDDNLRKQKPRVLYNMFRRELKRRGKSELAEKLDSGSSRTSPPPLPPPSSSKKK